jgi:K+-sensing histidine kinase KdpD
LETIEASYPLVPMQHMLYEHVTTPGEEGAAAQPNRVSVADIVEEVEVEAAADAEAGGFGLAVARAPRGVYVEADPRVLATAVKRLVDNAFRHSRTHGHVSLTTTATADRVLIEVEDECGGLTPGEAGEANGGVIRVRDLPGRGCVRTVDLPRLPPP